MEGIWEALLREKYGLQEDMEMEFFEKKTTSLIWKEIVWGAGLLNNGIRWELGGGKKIRFWDNV